MANSTVKAKDGRSLDYLLIDDFTAGIQSPQFNSFTPATNNFVENYTSGSTNLGAIPANMLGTYGCYAPANGGLFPFSSFLTVGNMPTPHNAPIAASTIYCPMAIQWSGSISFFLLMYTDASSHVNIDLWEVFNGTSFTFIDTQNTGASSLVSVFLAKTYLNLSGTITPCVVWGGDVIHTKYFDFVGSTTGTIDASTGLKSVFSHQGRIISFSDITAGADNILEAVNFTDPPQATTMGTQKELFWTENPSSYGAWGVISASELLLVKSTYGGVVVSGDVFSPYITSVPSIPGTQGFRGQAAVTAAGLCYISAGNGVWIWNGGAQAQKLSNNIQNNFYSENGAIPTSFLSSYNQFLLVQNGWIFDFETNAWWRLAMADTGSRYHAYTLGPDSNSFQAFPSNWVAGSNPPLWFFTQYNTGDSRWQWESQPIVVNQGEITEVREIVLHMTVCENSTFPTNFPVITLSVTASQTGSTPQVQTFTPTQYGAQQFRFECYVQSPAIVVSVSIGPSVGNNAVGPTSMQQVDIGYGTRWKSAVV